MGASPPCHVHPPSTQITPKVEQAYHLDEQTLVCFEAEIVLSESELVHCCANRPRKFSKRQPQREKVEVKVRDPPSACEAVPLHQLDAMCGISLQFRMREYTKCSCSRPGKFY